MLSGDNEIAQLEQFTALCTRTRDGKIVDMNQDFYDRLACLERKLAEHEAKSPNMAHGTG